MLLDRIELFVKVAKHRSLAKTARGMHVSSSSISQRLKSLENDFGVKLYKRNKDGIELTDSGHAVLSTASQVLDQIDNLRKTLNPNAQKAVKKLTIAATYNPSAKYLPLAIASFQKSHPEIELVFITSYRRIVEKCVRDGEADIALIQTPTQTSSLDLHFEHFVVDRLVFFAYAGHPVARKQTVRLEDLAALPLVIRNGKGTTHKALDLLRARGLKLNVALRCATPDAVKAAVRSKVGIGILFQNMIEEEVRRREFKPLRITALPALTGDTYIVYSKRKPLTLPASVFLELLRELKCKQKHPVALHGVTGAASS
jgi:DNA-binding transcriptional LysR family regulator